MKGKTFAEAEYFRLEEEHRREQEAEQRIADAALEAANRYLWDAFMAASGYYGPARGAYEVQGMFALVLMQWERANGINAPDPTPTKGKQAISQSLRTQVYERDQYRCVVCGTWKNLSLDHIIPESKGGPTTLENLQTMCRFHNSQKGDRL